MKLGAILAIVIGSLVLVLGALFLIAAVREPSRLLPAVPLLVVGAGLDGFGIWTLVRQKQRSPDVLDDSIVELARRSNGEVTIAEIVAQLRVPDAAAQQALDLLASRGQVRRELRDQRAVFVFPGLQESKVIKRCVHCGSTFSVAQPIKQCPNCGSNEIRVERT